MYYQNRERVGCAVRCSFLHIVQVFQKITSLDKERRRFLAYQTGCALGACPQLIELRSFIKSFSVSCAQLEITTVLSYGLALGKGVTEQKGAEDNEVAGTLVGGTKRITERRISNSLRIWSTPRVRIIKDSHLLGKRKKTKLTKWRKQFTVRRSSQLDLEWCCFAVFCTL